MNDFSVRKVREFFNIYYQNHSNFNIPQIERRELAFSFFDKSGMTRHTSFKSMEDLVEFTKMNPPQHFYYSTSYYENPSAEMELKKWEGADLVFDIDGDHIENADKMSYGEMLSAVRTELEKLIILLKDDLKVKDGDMEIVFSGSRGYHIHVYSIFNDLGSQERREIVDYITGKCLLPEYHLKPFTAWGKRVDDEVESLRSRIRTSRKWKEEAEKIAGKNLENLEKKSDYRIEQAIEKAARSVVLKKFTPLIDEPVTIDIHRLIRTPGGIHGKSGLMVVDIDHDKLGSFNPLNDTIPEEFRYEKTKINVIRKSRVEIGGEPKVLDEGIHNLLVFESLFLVLRGSAEFLEN